MDFRRHAATAPLHAALLLALAAAMGCASAASQQADPIPAPATPAAGNDSMALWTRAQHVFDTRCVACHGCFDAPCQLKLDSFEGIERGANPTRVYTARPLAIETTRLFVDAHDVATWRKKGFHAVVPEAASGDPVERSVLRRMLALKREHPLSADVDVASAFTFELNRKESCTKEDDFDAYAKEHPLWGMPYALPALTDEENDAIVRWIDAGMPHPDAPPLAPALQQRVGAWEAFFNDDSLRGRLVARYIFEHLFFASLYFDDLSAPTAAPSTAADLQEAVFFQMVRSRTPPGTPVDEIATRRPFDEPNVDRVFYRLVHRERQPLDKTHIPYPLSQKRMDWIRGLFFTPDVVVTTWPGYAPEVASNPFKAFAALPVSARYRFILEDAEYTMMGFIKGSACRGNVALNVINDRFWVTFVDPDSPWMVEQGKFLADNADLLDLPAEGGSNAGVIQWTQYGGKHQRYLEARSKWLKGLAAKGMAVTPELLWDGDGSNTNAALTIFRHYDHATIVKGLVGEQPTTAYVADYVLMERVTSLIVSGFDLFAGLSHQLQTRMYMDYLRMEGEYNFLLFLPPARRGQLVDNWYRGLSPSTKRSIDGYFTTFPGAPATRFTTPVPEHELFSLIEQRVQAVRARRFDPSSAAEPAVRGAIAALAKVKGRAAARMPELSFVEVTGAAEGSAWMTIVRNTAHSNVAQIFGEDKRHLPEEDDLTAVPGFLGAYPEAFFKVPRDEMEAFSAAVAALTDAPSYIALRQRWGVLRSDPKFWVHSDAVLAAARALDPIGSGIFDYGRLDPF